MTTTERNLNPKASIRCGKDTCEFWDKDSISKCNKYTDRRLCSTSMKQRKKGIQHSRRRGDTSFGY